MKHINIDQLVALSNQTHFTVPVIVIPSMWWGHILGDLATGKSTPLGIWIIASILFAVFIAGIALRCLFHKRRRIAIKKIGLLVQFVNSASGKGWVERTSQRRLSEQCEAFEKTYGFYPVESIKLGSS